MVLCRAFNNSPIFIAYEVTTVTQQTVIIVLLNTYSFSATLHHHKVMKKNDIINSHRLAWSLPEWRRRRLGSRGRTTKPRLLSFASAWRLVSNSVSAFQELVFEVSQRFLHISHISQAASSLSSGRLGLRLVGSCSSFSFQFIFVALSGWEKDLGIGVSEHQKDIS